MNFFLPMVNHMEDKQLYLESFGEIECYLALQTQEERKHRLPVA